MIPSRIGVGRRVPLALLVSLVISTAAAQVPQSSGETVFQRLDGLATRRLTMPPAEIRALVREALIEHDADTTKRALTVIGSYAFERRLATGVGREGDASRDPSVFLELRDEVLGLLRHADASVRRDALLAVGNLDLSTRYPESIAPDLAPILVDMFARDGAVIVRTEIAKAFALLDPKSALAGDVFRAALADPSAAVQKYGVMGVAERSQWDLLPAVAVLLQSAHSDVRMVAAGVIGAAGPAGRPYLGALRDAATAEEDAATLATMRASIETLSGAGRQ